MFCLYMKHKIFHTKVACSEREREREREMGVGVGSRGGEGGENNEEGGKMKEE